MFNPLPPQQKCDDPILLLCIRPRQGDFFGKKMQNQQKCANSSKSTKMCLELVFSSRQAGVLRKEWNHTNLSTQIC